MVEYVIRLPDGRYVDSAGQPSTLAAAQRFPWMTLATMTLIRLDLMGASIEAVTDADADDVNDPNRDM